MTLNWNGIRALNGSQATGFEELCAQLARIESTETADFVRKGYLDAGVECYCVLNDGSEWGWQAKYFLNALSGGQWSQLDDSVKRALEKHPSLTRYFVCIPRDRPDARTSGQKSEMRRWDERVVKWRGWARERSMDVEFVWWGSSELIERLSQNEHIGRRYFWFGQTGFDQEWFQARVNEAVDAAGPRYCQDLHIELGIARDLERFGRYELVFDEVKSLARGIRRAYEYLDLGKKSENAPDQAVSTERLSGLVDEILEMLSDVEPRPAGEVPFSYISDTVASAEKESDTIAVSLQNLEREHIDESQEGGDASRPDQNPFRDRRYDVFRLQNQLEEARTSLRHAHSFASGQLMLLRGNAGTGKTHLLCDVAQSRLASGRPTVLLMGQRFLNTDPPWTQALQHLDLPGVSANEFVGALEAAAQAADCRALFIIDALNEGQGRTIWPAHLAAFLQVLAKSPWIGVVLSVRSEYEEILLPEQVGKQAVVVTHRGFEECEYDATKAFFEYYELEFPATPILQPEFSNPLFLKVLCSGLQSIGERRLPPGFHGITRAFDLYFQAVNARLAESLDFNPNDQLVRKALNALADKLAQQIDTDTRSLARVEAEALVNRFLRGRGFENSLYRGLVVEGVLIEGISWRDDNEHSEVVYISYDRFADHIIANSLLNTHSDDANPEVAFQDGGTLAFLSDSSRYVSPGLIGALCIQVPERFGQELVTIAPKLLEWWGIGEAFRQSLVWRQVDAFSDQTQELLNSLVETQHDADGTWDTLLTVATIDGHPLNAEFLDRNLRRRSMPERDASWSIFLHDAWQTRGAVDRLVDWASSVSRDSEIDAGTVDLCALTLAWMLTTSNRFLRDRATKALVCLLTGRLDAVARLVERFAEVDDPYVAERVYAVAYGVAMRSHDPMEVGELASLVYERVFASGSPPVHILLRDYARGVVERAIYLDANLDIDESLIRPPYRTGWPHVPSEEELHALKLTSDQTRDDDNKVHPAKSTIIRSVMGEGDFAWYVIGPHSPWLSLRLNEEPWRSPDVRLTDLVGTFNAEEGSAWEGFKEAKKEEARIQHFKRLVSSRQADDRMELVQTEPPGGDSEPALAGEKHRIALESLLSTLRPDRFAEFNEIIQQRSQNPGGHAPRFDLSLIQRYVVWRVFDLGWTAERFGGFDELASRRSPYRAAWKAERVGKKYQWIAFHEFLAYIADHYQYVGAYGYGEVERYEGAWQDSLRDLDPSYTLRSTLGPASWESHAPSWWAPWQNESWSEDLEHSDWNRVNDDIPDVPALLNTRDSDGVQWLNLDGFFSWLQSHPADVEPHTLDRRRCWVRSKAFFVREEDSEAFLAWAKAVDHRGFLMPDQSISEIFLGEFMWSPAFQSLIQSYKEISGWTALEAGCPVAAQTATLDHRTESSSFDCSVDEGFTLQLPRQQLVAGLGLEWSGNGADYVECNGKLAAFDPTAHEAGPSALLIREDLMKKYLSDQGLALCWIVQGEKLVLPGRLTRNEFYKARIVGVYAYSDQGLEGFVGYQSAGQD